ncbi:MAG TPA: OmpA family protein [Bacteroidales bacterium]|nr:OmpA family protein [Bacteroidales bacterium]
MLRNCCCIIGFVTAFLVSANGQTENYYVTKAPFSAVGSDDFSPVYYKGGVIFCSNRHQKSFGRNVIADNKPFFRIFFSDTTTKKSEPRLLEGEINSNLNNGPATFNFSGDTAYFSRNLVVNGSFRDISSSTNKLGLFSAVLKNGRWEDIRELRFNDQAWNVTTPSLSPDGKRLYFASDKPEGYGGSDIYYSQWRNDYWDNPVNLGPVVNTSGNEAYPYVNSDGGLFYSSDTHPGKGGKDIFFTREVDSAWISPVPLAAPVNSSGNDFGFVADDLIGSGYFSSDRNGDVDIFYFKTVYPQFFYCEKQSEKRFCFTFIDDGSIEIDPLSLQFRWDFGGKQMTGYSAEHCFNGPGSYSMRQDIIDRKTGNVVFNKISAGLEIVHDGMPYIIAPENIKTGQQVTLRAEPDSPGFETFNYYWEVGNTIKGQGPELSYTTNESAPVDVRLLANIINKNTGKKMQVCVSRKIMTGASTDSTDIAKDTISASGRKNNIKINNIYSYSEELSGKPVFVVQVLESATEVPLKDLNVSPQYPVRKIRIGEAGTFSYVIAEEQDFMAAYNSLKDALSFGFRNALIRTYIPVDKGEAELWDFKRTYGTASSSYFVNNGFSISPDAASILDKLVLLLKRNPEMKLKIVAHTERTNNQKADIDLSSRQAESIVEYLIEQGISGDRLKSAGFGGLRLVAPEFPSSERMKNRRIDFLVSE